jgi:hypothetical protein
MPKFCGRTRNPRITSWSGARCNALPQASATVTPHGDSGLRASAPHREPYRAAARRRRLGVNHVSVRDGEAPPLVVAAPCPMAKR